MRHREKLRRGTRIVKHALRVLIALLVATAAADIMYLFRQPGDGERFVGTYRKRLRSADDIGSALAPGLSANDVRGLRALYDQ